MTWKIWPDDASIPLETSFIFLKHVESMLNMQSSILIFIIGLCYVGHRSSGKVNSDPSEDVLHQSPGQARDTRDRTTAPILIFVWYNDVWYRLCCPSLRWRINVNLSTRLLAFILWWRFLHRCGESWCATLCVSHGPGRHRLQTCCILYFFLLFVCRLKTEHFTNFLP